MYSQNHTPSPSSGFTPAFGQGALHVLLFHLNIYFLAFAAAFSKLKKTDIYETVVSEAAKTCVDSEAGPSTSTTSVVSKPSSSNSVLVSPKQVCGVILLIVNSLCFNSGKTKQFYPVVYLVWKL